MNYASSTGATGAINSTIYNCHHDLLISDSMNDWIHQNRNADIPCDFSWMMLNSRIALLSMACAEVRSSSGRGDSKRPDNVDLRQERIANNEAPRFSSTIMRAACHCAECFKSNKKVRSGSGLGETLKGHICAKRI